VTNLGTPVPFLVIFLFILEKLKKATLTVTASLLLLPGSSPLLSSERLETATVQPVVSLKTTPEVVQGTETKYWTCPGCTEVENKVLRAFQERGITDKVALAVLMGNIKQESKFITTICEGGVKTGYHACHRGGFGLIQWTTVGRYDGLGRVARQYKLDPNSLDAQLRWLFSEREWRVVEHRFKRTGMSSQYYMNAAYSWLGWGVYGARGTYARQYESFIRMPA